MRDVFKDIEEYNLGKTRKILIGSYDVVADTINNDIKIWCK